ncbi:hypothetical protein [Kaistella sp.]|uniref:hypothetical protein n=1 Tax=Kaistella sp. TaxID=2782235 RepID=UPI003C31B7ED
MGTVELKKSILNYLQEADGKLLKMVKAMMESYIENGVVAYSVDGKALSKSDYRKELMNTLQEIK